jgi:hypothetical protein
MRTRLEIHSMTTTLKAPWRRLEVWLLLAGTLLAGGCGKSTGSVSGKVTYKGQPLSSGKVTFLGERASAFGLIGPDGTYSIPNAPAGQVTITVENLKVVKSMTMDPSKMGGSASDAPPVRPSEPAVEAPIGYADAKTSRLTYEVKSGQQTHDIELD